jgi:hypothetical protein
MRINGVQEKVEFIPNAVKCSYELGAAPFQIRDR